MTQYIAMRAAGPEHPEEHTDILFAVPCTVAAIGQLQELTRRRDEMARFGDEGDALLSSVSPTDCWEHEELSGENFQPFLTTDVGRSKPKHVIVGPTVVSSHAFSFSASLYRFGKQHQYSHTIGRDELLAALAENIAGVPIALDSVSIPLLRMQRDYLLTLPEHEHVTGVVHLLDKMLDIAERSNRA